MKKLIIHCFVLYCLLSYTNTFGQSLQVSLTENDTINQFNRGKKQVNKCTPWHHLKCVYITGGEVVEDGLQGKATRHWWRKSYIGQACTETYGKTFGNIFEAFFVVPHYLSIAILNGFTYVGSLFRASPEKVTARKLRREKRRALRKERKRRRSMARLYN